MYILYTYTERTPSLKPNFFYGKEIQLDCVTLWIYISFTSSDPKTHTKLAAFHFLDLSLLRRPGHHMKTNQVNSSTINIFLSLAM